MDTKQHDKKYAFVRFNKPESPLEIQSRFVNARKSEKRGAAVGLTKNEVKLNLWVSVLMESQQTLAVILVCGLEWKSMSDSPH